MSSWPGFKIYSSSAMPGWLIAVKRKVVLVSEADDQFKLVSKYVTLKYQPSEMQSQITSDFNSFIGTITPAEKKAPSRDSVVEPIL
jgi:hypothetical protein